MRGNELKKGKKGFWILEDMPKGETESKRVHRYFNKRNSLKKGRVKGKKDGHPGNFGGSVKKNFQERGGKLTTNSGVLFGGNVSGGRGAVVGGGGDWGQKEKPGERGLRKKKLKG